jgi:hypothetical protein
MVELLDKTATKGRPFLMNNVTKDMKYPQSLMMFVKNMEPLEVAGNSTKAGVVSISGKAAGMEASKAWPARAKKRLTTHRE